MPQWYEMEFLSTEEKRNRTLKLFLGYFLIAITIGLATLLLTYIAQGYNYDTEKGVMQTGLVFFDSKPVSSQIIIDNQTKGATDSRMMLNEGRHEVTLKQTNYRDWKKTLSLAGGDVQYFLYPKLFPVNISKSVERVYDTAPLWASQSPDKKWLVIQTQLGSAAFTVLELDKMANEPKIVSIPASQLMYFNNEIGTLEPIEWSSDNQHLIIKQTLPDNSFSYILFNREKAEEIVNLSSMLNLSGNHSVVLKDKKYDKYYVFDKNDGNLFTADYRSGLTATPILKNVVSFKSHGEKLITYVTYEGAKSDEAAVGIFDGKNIYKLRSLTRDSNDKYLIDMAQYQDDWLYFSASASGNKVNIYRNPIKLAKSNSLGITTPQMSLIFQNPESISFSDNTRFIAAQSGKKFLVYDSEQNRIFRYTSSLSVEGQKAIWMDGHRLCAVANNKVYVFEFDGTNLEELVSGHNDFTAFFDKDYSNIFTFIPQINGKTGLQNGKLIAE